MPFREILPVTGVALLSCLLADKSHAEASDDQACAALITAVGGDPSDSDDPDRPKLYCQFQPLRDTDTYIVILLRDSKTSAYVDFGWYAIRRDNLAVYEIYEGSTTTDIDHAKLRPVRPPNNRWSGP